MLRTVKKTCTDAQPTSYAAVVTGATGYIGGHLVRRLLAEGHEVYAILRVSSDLTCLPSEICNDVHFHVQRYGEYDEMPQTFSEIAAREERSVLFHLAADVQSGNHRYEDIPRLMESNLAFGTALVDAAIRSGVKDVVSTGTYWQLDANGGYKPVNLYAATKQAFGDILQYYEDAEGLRVVTLLLYDTYGPSIGTRKRTKILDYLREHADEPVTVEMSPGEQRLSYVYIDDVVNAYLMAAARLVKDGVAACGTYAVRCEMDMSLRDIVERYLAMLGAHLHVHWGGRPYRPRDPMMPCETIPVLPGWRAEISLDEGLRRSLTDVH